MKTRSVSKFAAAAFVLLVLVCFAFAACGTENTESDETPQTEAGMKISVKVGDYEAEATLADTEAAKEFAAMLPLTLGMSELNGNEKYYYLDGSLSASATRSGNIKCGDIMLYGTSCVVLFYEDFATSYSYTPLGRIDDPDGLAQALGSGSVTVTFAPTEG